MHKYQWAGKKYRPTSEWEISICCTVVQNRQRLLISTVVPEPMFVCLTEAYIRYYVPKITVTMKENIVISWNGYAVMYFKSGFMHKVLLICHQFLIMYWECCSLVVWTHSHAFLGQGLHTQGSFDISSALNYVLNSPLFFGVVSQLRSKRNTVYSRYPAVSSPKELRKDVP